MKAVHAIVVVGIVLAAAAAGPRAQDPLSAAKDQYASAAYEDALSTLSRIDGAASGGARQVDEYRAFCLYALGRTREAESIAESMIRREPLARLDAADASPRLESMFAEVRKRLLPSLIRDRFRVARAALEQKSLSGAEPQLTEARLMIAEAERLGVKDDGLADLSVLVDGFLQLIRSSADQRPAALPARRPGVVDVPAVDEAGAHENLCRHLLKVAAPDGSRAGAGHHEIIAERRVTPAALDVDARDRR